MTRTLAPLRRVAALSVVITLFAAPITSAQSGGSAPSAPASAHRALISPAAFARLAQPPAAPAPAPAVTDPPGPSLLRQATAAMAREAQATAVKAPQQKSWASRHKTAIIVSSLIGGAVALGLTAWYIQTDGFCC